MSFSSYILEILQKQNEIAVPGFGTFYLMNANAVLGSDAQSILPPGKEINFKENFQDTENTFANYVAVKKDISVSDAEAEISKQVNFWNSVLQKEGKLIIDNLGSFFLNDSKIVFKGNRIANLSPDFYGLEEINLSEIKSPKAVKKATPKNTYRTTKTSYWLVPLVLGIVVLSYLGISQPELIFGQKSLLTDKPIAKTEKIPVKKDSSLSRNIASDSLKNDSTKLPATPQVPATN